MVKIHGSKVVFNVGTYMTAAMTKGDATLQTTMKALYDYNKKAVTYFE